MISVIVTTFNWPEALSLVLDSLIAQKTSTQFEVIVADDGSEESTQHIISEKLKSTNIALHHVWQEDKGFRAARIRNLAILKASYEYIVFLDGDCIVPTFFIEHQTHLMQEGTFLAGNRLLLSQNFTRVVLQGKRSLYKDPFLVWVYRRLTGQINRILPLFTIPLFFGRVTKKFHWKKVYGCNLSCFKKDLISVNGWDMKFVGWGFEDSDLIVRLLRAGLKRKSAKFYIPVFHLWHEERPRDKAEKNRDFLQKIIYSQKTIAEEGLDTLAIS